MAAVKTKAAKAATHRTKKRSQWRDVWLRLCRNKLAMIAMVVVLLLVLVAIFADFVPSQFSSYLNVFIYSSPLWIICRICSS